MAFSLRQEKKVATYFSHTTCPEIALFLDCELHALLYNAKDVILQKIFAFMGIQMPLLQRKTNAKCMQHAD